MAWKNFSTSCVISGMASEHVLHVTFHTTCTQPIVFTALGQLIGMKWSETQAGTTLARQWAPLRVWLRAFGPAHHHIDSYEQSLRVDVPALFKSAPVEVFEEDEAKRVNPEIAGIRVKFLGLSYGSPTDGEGTVQWRPIDARDALETYCHPAFLDVQVETLGPDRSVTGVTRHPTVRLGDIPTLVRSQFCATRQTASLRPQDVAECMFDTAYFVVNDVEKMFVSHEGGMPNRAVITRRRDGTRWQALMARLDCSHPEPGRGTNTIYFRATQRGDGGGWVVRVLLPFIKYHFPVVTVLKAMGVPTDEQVVGLMFAQEEICGTVESVLHGCFQDAGPNLTPAAAEAAIEARTPESVRWADVLAADVLPNVQGGREARIATLASVCRRLIRCAAGLDHTDDRDHMKWKSLVTTGNMFTHLFSTVLVKRVRKDVEAAASKALTTRERPWDVHTAVNPTVVFKGLKYCISTGNLATGKSGGAAGGGQQTVTGVTQLVSRLSLLAALSQSRRVNSLLQREGRQSAPRELHGTQVGRYCPADTPEGQPVGLVHFLAMSHAVSVDCPSAAKLIRRLLHTGKMGEFLAVNAPRDSWGEEGMMLFVDGSAEAVLQQPCVAQRYLAQLRRTLALPADVAIAMNVLRRELHIKTTGGRQLAIRAHADTANALLGVGGPGDNPQWEVAALPSDVLPYIALLDPEEEEATLVATSVAQLLAAPAHQPFTHTDLHFSANLGLASLTNPFPDHNQAPRNTYADAMGKQGMGVPQMSWGSTFLTSTNVLETPQRPVATSHAAEASGLNDAPSGQMFVVAVLCDDDRTIEDAIQISRKSAQLGLGACEVYKSVDSTEAREFEQFGKPDPTKTVFMKKASYDVIGDDGMPKLGVTVGEHDVVIGKTMNLSTKRNGAADNTAAALRKDVSLRTRNSESGVVHAVRKGQTHRGHRVAKVMLRQRREVVVGSKFSTRHGMKGTVGMAFDVEDAPFDPLTGITPDIIMNPHGKPSRMSWGEMFEALVSMVGLHNGRQFDTTPFGEEDHREFIERVRAEIRSMGVDGNCHVLLHSGRTGEPIGRAFMGPIFVQRLKHMVEDKIHGRWRGPRTMLMRAPTEGRTKGCGYRIGEMEKSCLESHGAAEFVRERLFTQSQYSVQPVCTHCGMFAVANRRSGFSMCTLCNRRGTVGFVEMPYATKVLFQLLTSVNVVPRIKLESREE